MEKTFPKHTPTLRRYIDNGFSFSAQSGMIFGTSSDCGQSILSECIEIRGQLTLMLWCDDFETKFETQILTRLCDFVMTFQQRSMRSIASRERRFYPTLILESHLSRATAIFAPPDTPAFPPTKIKSKQTKNPHVPVTQWLERWLSTNGRGLDTLQKYSLI